MAVAGSAASTKYYLQQSGKANKVLRSHPRVFHMEVRLRNEKGRLVLASTRKGRQPCKKAGTYKLAVKTTCAWAVSHLCAK